MVRRNKTLVTARLLARTDPESAARQMKAAKVGWRLRKQEDVERLAKIWDIEVREEEVKCERRRLLDEKNTAHAEHVEGIRLLLQVEEIHRLKFEPLKEQLKGWKNFCGDKSPFEGDVDLQVGGLKAVVLARVLSVVQRTSGELSFDDYRRLLRHATKIQRVNLNL